MYRLDLDITDQQQLYERACRRMAQTIPGWNDDIPSDPAVALLELASYLSSVQDREIDRLRERHYLAYLELLGGSPRKLAPARLLAVPITDAMPWPGMRFEVDGVPFEVLDVPGNGAARVRSAALICGGRRVELREDMPLAVPHDTPAALEIVSSVPLALRTPVPIWLELQPEPGRVPPDEETPPPIRLTAQAWADGAWQDAPCQDGTCGLLRSGYVTASLPASSDRLRLLMTGAIEGRPRISAVALCPITLEQRRTRSRCIDLEAPYLLPWDRTEERIVRLFRPQGGGWLEDETLFVRDGRVCGPSETLPPQIRVVAAEPDLPALYALRELPGEEICLEEDGISPELLHLMVEEDGVWYDCPVSRPEEGRTLDRGCRWDASRKTLRFGDGRDVRVPRAGQLLLAGCVCTLGAGGNGAGGLLERGEVSLRPLRPAWGGQDAEDGKSAFFRTAKELELPARAVSLSDYEALALRAPGLALDRVKAVPAAKLGGQGPGVVVLAKPRSTDRSPALTQWQRERLLAWLEPFRMIGVPLEVRGPRYCPIQVDVRIRSNGTAAERLLEAVTIQHTDGVTGPLDFGARLSYTALFSALSAAPGVGTIQALELRALSGSGRRTREGGVGLDADTLPYLERFRSTQG